MTFADGPSPILLDLELRPHRSLPTRGFVVVMAALAVASLATGIGFTLAGAWPVVGFLGLDVLAVWLAFRVSYGRARTVERLRLSPDALTVERIAPRRRPQAWRFEPAWLRVEIDEPARPQSRLVLASHGRMLEIGAFLAPDERAAAARRIRAALRDWRRPASPADDRR
ncbi:MAG: DUF2244 domain-containing protein [Alphaproteobacteria bacterium]